MLDPVWYFGNIFAAAQGLRTPGNGRIPVDVSVAQESPEDLQTRQDVGVH